MLKLIKRMVGIDSAKAAPPARPARRTERRAPAFSMSGPAPLPDVVEGNDQKDWELWKDSVDSQMNSGFLPSSQLYPDTQPSQLDEVDPFARVSKRDR